MKKLLSVTAALLAVCTVSFAQAQGEKAIDGSLGLNVGTIGSSYSTVEFDISAGISYFALDNLRLSLDLGYGITSMHSGSKNNSDYLKENTGAFIINPNVAYYVKIFDKFYYTPEFGLAFNVGSTTNYYSVDFTNTVVSEKFSNDFVFGIYVNFLAVEYRINKNFAAFGQLGSIGYQSSTSTLVSNNNIKSRSNSFLFNLNNASFGVRYFF